jgi:hypothetical protein
VIKKVVSAQTVGISFLKQRIRKLEEEMEKLVLNPEAGALHPIVVRLIGMVRKDIACHSERLHKEHIELMTKTGHAF